MLKSCKRKTGKPSVGKQHPLSVQLLADRCASKSQNKASEGREKRQQTQELDDEYSEPKIQVIPY